MRRFHKEKWGYLFLVPWFLFFAVFTVYPFMFGLVASFTDYNLSGMRFTGLDNFKKIFTDQAVGRSLIATLLYTLIISALTILLSLWIADDLRLRGRHFNSFVKAVLYIPGIATTAALTIAWKYMLSPTFGIVSILLSRIGINVNLLDTPLYVIPIISILITGISLGQPVILYTAAMGGIPESFYEVAELEGAKGFQVFRRITLPLIQPTTIFILVSNTIGLLQVFVVPYLLTGGGPAYRTSTLLLLIYNSAFLNGSFGYASAIGNVLFITACLLSAVQFKIMHRDVIEY
jgi:multiple sugar transport system permease protein